MFDNNRRFNGQTISLFSLLLLEIRGRFPPKKTRSHPSRRPCCLLHFALFYLVILPKNAQHYTIATLSLSTVYCPLSNFHCPLSTVHCPSVHSPALEIVIQHIIHIIHYAAQSSSYPPISVLHSFHSFPPFLATYRHRPPSSTLYAIPPFHRSERRWI